MWTHTEHPRRWRRESSGWRAKLKIPGTRKAGICGPEFEPRPAGTLNHGKIWPGIAPDVRS
jgi:hypothetical protein